MRWWSTALFAVLALGVPPRASAYEPKDEARAHYARGLVLANDRSYDAALQEFKEAYAISPQYAVLYNIGQADRALGRVTEAIDALSKYLGEGQEHIPVPRREQVKAQIVQLQLRLATVVVVTDPPGARIILDGRELGTTPLADPVQVNAGAHKITAIAEGAAPVSRIVSIAEGQRQDVHIELPPPSPEAALAAAREAAKAASAASASAVEAAKAAEAAAKVAVNAAIRPSQKAMASQMKASFEAARAAEIAGSAELRERRARQLAAPGGTSSGGGGGR